jgi:CheY-specific phosphatase CheX
MDKSALSEAMKASISEVLEQMFFMPIDLTVPEKAGADSKLDPVPILAKLEFGGASRGTFLLLIPSGLAQSVAADFLGITTQSLAQEQVAGTVLEMVNMLAGSTLSTYDHQALFDLQIPELISVNELGALIAGCADRVVIRIQTPDSRMTFQVVWK